MSATVPAVVVAGLGCRDRRDDGVGIAVAAGVADALGGVADIGPVSEPLDLLGRWDGAALAVLIDAVVSGCPAGTLRWLDLGDAPPMGPDRDPCVAAHLATTHGIGLAAVCRLAATLGTKPARVVVLGIEGTDFSRGSSLTPRVEAAVPEAVRQVVSLVQQVSRAGDRGPASRGPE